MPGLTARVSTLLRVKISALLNRLENPAETVDSSGRGRLVVDHAPPAGRR